ncbi:MAG: hypothetical protein COB78_07535 [Hyphomicrobiales bacterium]|nr:MAG: hypothetical protein COB78_07535 [Hyphomicrobiales bacterium]
MKKIALLVLLSVSVSACDRTSRSFGALSLQKRLPPKTHEIVPSALPRIGRLYFSGDGRRPVFSLPDGTIYNRLCYDDFAKDNKLKQISNYIIDDGIVIDKKTVTQKLGGNVSLSLSKFKKFGNIGFDAKGNRNRVYTITQAHQLSLLDSGVDLVKSEIGDNCRQAIASLQKSGRNVVLILSAVKANSISDITNLSGSGKIGIPTIGFGIGGTYERNNAETYSNVIIGINPDEFL